MNVQIKEVKTKKDLHEFIYLPEKIHKDHKNWMHPIYSDDETFFNPKTNKSFSYCDYKLLLAIKDNKVVGRCMGLIHKKYNAEHNEKSGRFSFIETYNDGEVFHALIDYVAKWAKEKGMETLVGPLAFSDKDPQGFLIEGYDEVHIISTGCNFPYMNDFCEKEGFIKKVDLVDYKIEIPETFPPVYERIAERFSKNHQNIKILEFNSKVKFRPFIRPVLSLINKTFTDIYGFTPFSEKDMDDFANRFIFLLDPHFLKVAVNEKNEVIGNIIAMPDISEGINKCRGRLLPFGFLDVLKSSRKTERLVLLLGSVDPRYQGRGVEIMMGIKMLESAKKYGKTVIDSHLELETNTKVRAEMEHMGGVVYKKFRIYQKEI